MTVRYKFGRGERSGGAPAEEGLSFVEFQLPTHGAFGLFGGGFSFVFGLIAKFRGPGKFDSEHAEARDDYQQPRARQNQHGHAGEHNDPADDKDASALAMLFHDVGNGGDQRHGGHRAFVDDNVEVEIDRAARPP
jgi:hypothetical protein